MPSIPLRAGLALRLDTCVITGQARAGGQLGDGTSLSVVLKHARFIKDGRKDSDSAKSESSPGGIYLSVSAHCRKSMASAKSNSFYLECTILKHLVQMLGLRLLS